MRMRVFAIFAVLGALAAACSPPKYADYKSVSGDFTVAAPWGWNVLADADHDSFSQVTFIGPFDMDYYLGAPSLSVRWYKPYRPHRLRNGSYEMYANSDDFIRQTLKDVYGKDAIVYGVGKREDGGRMLVDKAHPIPTFYLKDSGLPAKFFAVLSPTPAPQGITIGTEVNEKGARMNARYHEYVVVPIDDPDSGREEGFYVLCYPATMLAHDKGIDRFRALYNTFHPYTAGPGGEKILLHRPPES
ncbi:MAG TPA: hypothetical protein VH309_13025 [Elusimicrobiota bacterium]|nr:hypothetical protein [Elusimicrobiota bacterium]